MHVVFTQWMFVEICDIHTLIWADSLGTDAVTHYILLNMDNTKCTITFPLPVNFIIVHLEHKETNRNHE